MSGLDVDALITALDLSPHPEGGFYRETFRSPAAVLGPGGSTRAACTQILFLLPGGVFSAWHRVTSDEIWQHHEGGPLHLHLLGENGHQRLTLGRATDRLLPSAVVPAGVWQAAEPATDAGVLCGCTVAPGFDFEDFEMAHVEALAAAFPDFAQVVRRLCR